MIKADMIIINGVVLTMDPAQPRAEAVAIKDGVILSVGRKSDILALKSDGTKIFDARGHTVMPGFIESHMHLFPGAEELTMLQLPGVKGLENVKALATEYAAKHPEHTLLRAQGAGYDIFGVNERPTRHHLDQIIPDKPFVITAHCHHTAWANTVALEKAGMLHGKKLGPGNEVVMGNDGLANGELREMEAMQCLYSIGEPSRDFLGLEGVEPSPDLTEADRQKDRETLRKGLSYCAKLGITSIQNMDGNLYQLEQLEKIEQEDGHLKCRTQIPFHYKNFMKVSDLEKASEMSLRFGSETLRCGRVKAFYDGVIESYTATMADNYADKPECNGEPLFSGAHLNEMVAEADRRGLQVSIHSLGDGAVHAVLNAYEHAQRLNGARDSRHRVEHLEVILPSDIERFRQLGVIASMQPLHMPGALDGQKEPTASILGHDRWRYAYAQRTMLQSGAVVAFASDWPVVSLNPMDSLKAAMLRRPWDKDLPDQRFSLHESLYAYTHAGAYTEFKEDCKGMLKAGFFADICVLSEDIENTHPEEIDRVTVDLTLCGGIITHSAL